MSDVRYDARKNQPFVTNHEARHQRATDNSAFVERITTESATFILVATILFLLIGPTPYAHGRSLDSLTGGSVLSPLYRYIWFTLTGLAIPVLWMRRDGLRTLFSRSWPLFILFLWFAASTRWALDPETSQRRLLLLLCQTTICVSCCLGLRRPQAMHRALANSCAIIVLIDLASWILLPGLSKTDIGLAAIHNHKNSLGLAMLFAEFVSATFVFTQTAWRGRLFWIFIMMAAGALLIASQSKTSLNITLAAFIATPPLLWLLSRRKAVVLGAVACGVALLVAALFLWLCISYVEGEDPLRPLHGVTFTQRTDVWQFVLRQIALRPWRGAGFASFWDINPVVQPSLQTDYWFAQPDSPTNEAHDGYLDLLVTTGFVGLAGCLFVLLRWILTGARLLRGALRSSAADSRVDIPYRTFLCFFPILVALHNFLESSYFSTVGLFSFAVILLGLDADLRRPSPPIWVRPRVLARRTSPSVANDFRASAKPLESN